MHLPIGNGGKNLHLPTGTGGKNVHLPRGTGDKNVHRATGTGGKKKIGLYSRNLFSELNMLKALVTGRLAVQTTANYKNMYVS